MLLKSFISRVILLNILIVAIGVGIFSLFFIHREHSRMIASAQESAELLLYTVEKSIFNSMRVGNSNDVQSTLELVGRSDHLADVRIFHPDGTILRSAKPQEIGSRIDPETMALFADQRPSGIYRLQSVQVLGLVKPIVAEESCFLCHGFGRKVLGVLNLNLSLAGTNQKLRHTTQFFLLSTAVIVVLLSAGISFVLLRFVKRPIQTMVNRMVQVEAGDLSVRLNPSCEDEIGSLMRGFNSMVNHMEKAKQELECCHYQQMERADRLASVGEMSTGVAHEIKNPLAGISGAISVLADEFAEDDPRREIVRQVLEQIARLDKTATDLLCFGRPSHPEFSWVDINALVKKTLFFVVQHPEASNIHRVKELTRDLPPVWVDEKQIQQVLFNVIINAIQAMKSGGTLLIETDAVTREDGQFVRVTITDTGKGIAPEELERIFVPFHTTKTQGTGLGLPISRQLMEHHGGSIKVKSQIGEGTTFTIELPVLSEQLRKEVNSAQA